MEKADIIIIGAGAAGLFTALKLDKKYKVVIVEKEAFPHDKLCGGLMCRDAFNLIEPLNPPPAVFYTPATLQINVLDQDNHLSFTPAEIFHNLNRRSFYSWIQTLLGDNVLIKNLAIPQKIIFNDTNFLVTIRDHEKKESSLCAPVLIGADGVNSYVRHSFFSTRPPFINLVQYSAKCSAPVNNGYFIFNASLARGYYSWVIPKDDAIVCGTRIERDNYKQLLERMADEYKIQKNGYIKKGHPITKINSTEELILGKGRLLLVGEAAGLVRPSSGEGLSLALQSAEYAATAIHSASQNPAEEYKKLCSLLFPMLNRDIKAACQIFDPIMRKKYFSGTSD